MAAAFWPRTPSLAALRAFESVARQLSFTKAAAELSLTQGAISYQVRQLEQDVGVLLFHRDAREIRLSEEAKLLLPTIQRAFADISQGLSAIRPDSPDQPVVIALSTYFAAHWLLRRLARFWQLYPGVKLRLQHPASISGSDVHMAIQWHKADWDDPQLLASLLFLSDVSPVCSPQLVLQDRPLNTPRDLLRHTLLRDEITREAWTDWFTAAGLDESGVVQELNINDPNVYTQAAIDGQGIAMGDTLIADDILLGRLRRPFDLALKGYGYFLVCKPEAVKRRSVKTFCDWLLSEAKAEGKAP